MANIISSKTKKLITPRLCVIFIDGVVFSDLLFTPLSWHLFFAPVHGMNEIGGPGPGAGPIINVAIGFVSEPYYGGAKMANTIFSKTNKNS